jgi:hypothetical protein
MVARRKLLKRSEKGILSLEIQERIYGKKDLLRN